MFFTLVFLQNLTNDSPHHKEKTLCNCELQESNGTLTIRSDSSIGLHLNLYGCIVEDARENKVTAFPRYLRDFNQMQKVH